MNSRVSITITDNETGDVVSKVDYNNLRQFRLVCFKDGRLDIYGKLPWKVMKTPLREWTQVWAEAHSWEFETLVRQYRPETTDEEIISLLHDMENEAVKLLVPGNGKRNRAVASHVWQELLGAITMTVRKVATKTDTIWEFPQSMIDTTNGNGVLGWLFRKGGSDGYNN